MNLSNARAFFGLAANAAPTKTLVAGSVQIGQAAAQLSFPDADIAYAVKAVFIGSPLSFDLDTPTGVATTSDTFVAGVAQVETATASGTASANGNVAVTVTSAGMDGSPLTIQVPVSSGDIATAWAAKVRAALAANAAVSGRFNVNTTGLIPSADIILTRKPTDEFEGIPLYAANDTTLNIAIANGSPDPGITPAATSANTTAGVTTIGVKITDGDGKDFEGGTLATMSELLGLLVLTDGGVVIKNDPETYKFQIPDSDNGKMLLTGSWSAPDINIESRSTQTSATVIVIGKSA